MENTKIICGLDEAGRGPLAGPLVAAAVVLNLAFTTPIRDGKLLSRLQREKIYEELKKTKSLIEVEIISTKLINSKGIGWANKEIFRRLIKKVKADLYIVDGNLKINRPNVKSIINADANIPVVILAGIVAKVERDKIMTKLHRKFPLYNWKQNAGYGTKEHIKIICEYGACREHRNIFVNSAIKNYYAKSLAE